MSPLVVGLILTAAILHATWNAILRGAPDRLWSITIMGAVGAMAALPLAVASPKPALESWRFIALSVTLQVGYCLFLVRAYRTGHLAHVYPIARGSAPLLVTLAAALFAGERLGGPGLAGVVLVSGGIMVLTLGRDRPDLPSSLAALAAGVFIASYMLADGLGVRLSRSAIGYAAWQTVAQGVTMPVAYWAVRRQWPPLPKPSSDAPIIGAAIIGAFGYGVVIWAMSLGPMGKVSALRETSILFATLLGAVFLKEPLTPRRAIGAAVIAAGAICLSAL
jgi:drug/metabolite transporter (DMT)-like permease